MGVLVCREVEVQLVHKLEDGVGERFEHVVGLVSELYRFDLKLLGAFDKVTESLSESVLMEVEHVVGQQLSRDTVLEA